MADVSNITKIECTLNPPDSIILTGTTRAYVTNQSRRKSQQKQFLMKRVLAKRPIIRFRQLRTLRRDTVHSISVYRKKVQKEASQSTDTNSPSATPEADFAKAPNARVTQQEQDVKQKYSYSTEINFTTSCTRTLFVEEEITSREHSINEY